MNVDTRRFDASDWVLLGYVLGILLYYVGHRLLVEPVESSSWTDQEVTLQEDHLQRLEAGEPVTLPRWHGHDLVLEGTVWVNAEEESNSD